MKFLAFYVLSKKVRVFLSLDRFELISDLVLSCIDLSLSVGSSKYSIYRVGSVG